MTLQPEAYDTDELRRTIWELQFSGLTQRQMLERAGVPENVFKQLRGEVLVTFVPRPDQVRRLQERKSWNGY